MKEYLDILDEYGNKTGIIKERSNINNDKEFIRTVHIWIMNPETKKILVQRRSSCKSDAPNKWDLSAGGHILSGEKSIDAIIRETKEEIGLDITNDKFIKLFENKHNGNKNKYFHDVYFLEKAIDINMLKLQKSEVQDIRYFDLLELKSMLKNKELVKQPYLDKLFEYIKNIIK